jgi:ATP-binding cassette, subfamily B, multidrug efflux pump
VKYLSYLNKYFYQYKKLLLLGLLFVSASNYFRVLQPRWIRDAMDLVVVNLETYQMLKGFEAQSKLYEALALQVIFFGIAVMGAALMMGLFMYFMRQTIIVMSRLIEYDLRKEIFQHYEDLDQGFYRKNSTGDMMSRITEDVSKVRMYLGPGVLYAINLIFLFVFVIWSMISVNPTLTFYSLLPLPFLSLAIYYVSMIINRRSEKIQEQLSYLNSIAQEVYSGIRVVKSYGQEDNMKNWFAKESDQFLHKSMGLIKVESLFYPVMLLIIGAATVITIYVGGLQVDRGLVTAGNIAEFVIYVSMLTWPVTSIGWVASLVQRAAASMKRIMEFLGEEPKLKAQGNYQPESMGDIELKGVSFVYPDTGIQALKNINLTIRKGEKIMIMGRTGSGKTTIVDLMTRLFDPSEGEIRIGNVPLKEYSLSYLRDKIGYVPQDVFLFSDSIANNVAFGRDNLSQEEIEQQSRNASVYEDILKFPQGFETVIGERGVSLSGGQKQRISIARAFAKEPEILFLDDSLSAVDTNTEQSILEYFEKSFTGKTVIVVTHRIYNLLEFDKIVVLDGGKILEEGTHKALIKSDGYYAKIYQQQKFEDNSIKTSL